MALLCSMKANPWLSDTGLRFSQEGHWGVVLDAYPVSPGHTLLFSMRGRKALSECPESEVIDLHFALSRLKAELLKDLRPDGFNIGINEGEAAGQTVEVLHVHLIPRYAKDMADPRGGVRGVIPEKQKY